MQPVAAWTVDNTNGMTAFLGRAAYETVGENAVNDHLMPDYVPVPGAPDFFVDGAHRCLNFGFAERVVNGLFERTL